MRVRALAAALTLTVAAAAAGAAQAAAEGADATPARALGATAAQPTAGPLARVEVPTPRRIRDEPRTRARLRVAGDYEGWARVVQRGAGVVLSHGLG